MNRSAMVKREGFDIFKFHSHFGNFDIFRAAFLRIIAGVLQKKKKALTPLSTKVPSYLGLEISMLQGNVNRKGLVENKCQEEKSRLKL